MTVDPTTPAQAVVQITLGQVYSEVTGLRSDVRDLTSSVRTAVAQLGDHETRLRALEVQAAQSTDHEPRLASVEKRVWMASGIAALLAGGASAAATLLTSGR